MTPYEASSASEQARRASASSPSGDGAWGRSTQRGGCKQHAWRTRSRNHRYVVVVCTVCGEVRGAMPAYLSAEIAVALAPSVDRFPDRHVALP